MKRSIVNSLLAVLLLVGTVSAQPSGGGTVNLRTNEGMLSSGTAAPAGTERGLHVRQVGALSASVTGFPTAFLSADTIADQTATAIHGFSFFYNGTTWDRMRGDTTNGLWVNCKSGCSGSSFADNAAFTFGTTTIGFAGGVLDDVGTNACTENSACAPRLSSRRELYLQIRDAAGNERGANVNASNRLTVSVDNVPSVTGAVSVTGTVTTTPPSNASTNITQFAGVAVATGPGVSTGGTPRVALTSDSALASNQSTNVAQFGGTNISTGTGSGGAGIPRVTISSDSSLAANQSVNVAQFGGTATSLGSKATNASVPVVLASDQPAISINQTQINGIATATGGTAGSQGIGGLQPHDSGPIGNPVVLGGIAYTDAVQPATVAGGNVSRLFLSTEGQLLVRNDHPKRILCVQTSTSVTILTKMGGSCAAPGAGKSIYLTDLIFTAAANGGGAPDSHPTLKMGTGGHCGSSTTTIWAAINSASQPIVQSWMTPIKLTANNELCFIMSTAGNKTISAYGFIAP